MHCKIKSYSIFYFDYKWNLFFEMYQKQMDQFIIYIFLNQIDLPNILVRLFNFFWINIQKKVIKDIVSNNIFQGYDNLINFFSCTIISIKNMLLYSIIK